MSAPVEQKMISVCFLDLLHRLAVQARAKPEETKYLNAIVRALEEIKANDGFADGNNRVSRVAGQETWGKNTLPGFKNPNFRPGRTNGNSLLLPMASKHNEIRP